MSEIWKRFEKTTYLVSDQGRVMNGDKIMALCVNSHGYNYLDIWYEGKRRLLLVHRLVALCFLENPENKLTVNHKDGRKTNNTRDNLEWATYAENIQHAYATGLNHVGSASVNAKLNEEDVLKIHALLVDGVSNQEVADFYEVSSGTISEIRLGRTWKHVERTTLEKSGANPIKRLEAADIPDIRRLYSAGKNCAEIGAIYKVARGTIHQIIAGKTWKNY